VQCPENCSEHGTTKNVLEGVAWKAIVFTLLF
jgi:hypothetical protein